MKLKDFPKIDLPREKLLKYGAKKLSDVELLALLLGSGIKGTNVLQLSSKILQSIKKAGINNIQIENLKNIKGLGNAKLAQMMATIELGKRLQEKERVEVLSAEDVWKLCVDIKDSKKEHFLAFYLDSQNRLIERQVISIGTINSSLVHPREVFEPAIKLSSTSVIVAHNHPSGSLEPSNEDTQITKKLIDAGKILGIEVLDHIIITNSFHKSINTNS